MSICTPIRLFIVDGWKATGEGSAIVNRFLKNWAAALFLFNLSAV